jgi:hypothetical protein
VNGDPFQYRQLVPGRLGQDTLPFEPDKTFVGPELAPHRPFGNPEVAGNDAGYFVLTFYFTRLQRHGTTAYAQGKGPPVPVKNSAPYGLYFVRDYFLAVSDSAVVISQEILNVNQTRPQNSDDQHKDNTDKINPEMSSP